MDQNLRKSGGFSARRLIKKFLTKIQNTLTFTLSLSLRVTPLGIRKLEPLRYPRRCLLILYLAVYICCHRVSVHPSVYPSVRPSEAGTVPNWLNIGSRNQCHMIAQGFQFSCVNGVGKIPMESPPRGRQIKVG